MSEVMAPEETRTGTRLQAKNITIGYDSRIISDGLTLDIPDGKFTVIVGPNACGKSTLLRALSRLLAPSSGEVLLDGKAIASHPANRSRGSWVYCRSPPSHPTVSGWPISSHAAGFRTRISSASGPGRTRPRWWRRWPRPG